MKIIPFLKYRCTIFPTFMKMKFKRKVCIIILPRILLSDIAKAMIFPNASWNYKEQHLLFLDDL